MAAAAGAAAADASKLGANGQKLCTRDRCKRWRGLNEFGLCGAHGCPTPNCNQSKSSTEQLCDQHKAGKALPLPKGWELLELGEGIALFLNTKLQTAQYNHPGPKGEATLPRSSIKKVEKTKKGFPVIYVVEPQPKNLPEGWEQVLAVVETKKNENAAAPQTLYRNNLQNIIQSSDPRPEEDENLPSGWKIAYDPEGDVYYIDENSDFVTYDDPRLVDAPTEAKSLAQRFKRKNTRHMSKRGTAKTTWTIGPCDVDKFDTLELHLTMPEEVPECVRNKILNRYMDILPNPKTRVPLEKLNNDPMTEYINANFVRGFDGNPKTYIAAQGPKDNCVGHFWRMIFNEKVNAIIMVTNLAEKGKSKCERYWPAEGDGKTTMTFDGISVVNTQIKTMPGYTINFLRATRGQESLNVLHYWYNTWPDHGVPRTANGTPFVDDVIGMIRHMQQVLKRRPNPILVHCSAGVGRTGTIIAVDHATRLLEAKGKADCLAIIDNIREDRCALVQHNNQFEFLHEATVRYAELAKKPYKVEEFVAKQEERKELSSEALAALRKVEKEEATKRNEAASSKGGRKRMLSASHIDGVLRLGVLSLKGEKFSFVDVDGDGTMEWKEAQLQGMSRDLFDKLDTNRDGHVSKAEWQAFLAKEK